MEVEPTLNMMQEFSDLPGLKKGHINNYYLVDEYIKEMGQETPTR